MLARRAAARRRQVDADVPVAEPARRAAPAGRRRRRGRPAARRARGRRDQRGAGRGDPVQHREARRAGATTGRPGRRTARVVPRPDGSRDRYGCEPATDVRDPIGETAVCQTPAVTAATRTAGCCGACARLHPGPHAAVTAAVVALAVVGRSAARRGCCGWGSRRWPGSWRSAGATTHATPAGTGAGIVPRSRWSAAGHCPRAASRPPVFAAPNCCPAVLPGRRPGRGHRARARCTPRRWRYDLWLKATTLSLLPWACRSGSYPLRDVRAPAARVACAWGSVVVLLGAGAHLANAARDIAGDHRAGVAGLANA